MHLMLRTGLSAALSALPPNCPFNPDTSYPQQALTIVTLHSEVCPFSLVKWPKEILEQFAIHASNWSRINAHTRVFLISCPENEKRFLHLVLCGLKMF